MLGGKFRPGVSRWDSMGLESPATAAGMCTLYQTLRYFGTDSMGARCLNTFENLGRRSYRNRHNTGIWKSNMTPYACPKSRTSGISSTTLKEGCRRRGK